MCLAHLVPGSLHSQPSAALHSSVQQMLPLAPTHAQAQAHARHPPTSSMSSAFCPSAALSTLKPALLSMVWMTI